MRLRQKRAACCGRPSTVQSNVLRFWKESCSPCLMTIVSQTTDFDLRRPPDPVVTAQSHKLSDEPPLYAIGSFDTRVTVLSQQTRALNLAWSLVETGVVPIRGDARRSKIAVVGAGFAGLTFAAGLLRKEANCDLFIFEQRDTLLPLQQGSDTRWLHPHIYDWPADGSEASAAMLPVLNWTAARSSDVVVQVLGEWAQVASDNSIRLFCNTRHLQLARCRDHSDRARVEWVGEERNAADGTVRDANGSAKGLAETFDAVVLAVGFGLEAGKASYWRNETLGQPNLNEPRRTYLLSGQGDGAMIDLLRIRVSQFRQDRILEELFGGRPQLMAELKQLRRDFLRDETGLFERFETLAAEGSPHHKAMEEVILGLDRRLRRDTDVVLKLLVRNVAELLEPANSRMSFQNALLVFLLYRCGGFAPSTENSSELLERFGITGTAVIERHGVRPLDQLKRMLPDDVFDFVQRRRGTDPKTYGLQSAKSLWPGGYFGYRGRSADAGLISNDARRQWRKEYLPGPTALVATTFCGAVAGMLERSRPEALHFRVALHRTLSIHGEDLLQQACDYTGRGLQDASATAGRTYPAAVATIGAAYRCRRIVRTPKEISEQKLQDGMTELKLHEAARAMLPGVSFVLAMPLLQPEAQHYGPGPVAAVLYIDSRDADFWLTDAEVNELKLLLQGTMRAIDPPNGASLGRVRNVPLEPILNAPREPAAVTTGTVALEIVSAIMPPTTTDEFVLNFDHTDLAPVTTGSTTTREPEARTKANA